MAFRDRVINLALFSVLVIGTALFVALTWDMLKGAVS